MSAAALMFAAVTLLGCSSSGSGYSEDTYAISKGHDRHAVVIGGGRLAKNRWSLSATVNGEGQLCLGVRWTPRSEPTDVGCGFGSNKVDDEGRGTEPTDTSQAADGSVLTFGPSPAGAVTARLSTPAVAGTGCTSQTVPTTDVPIPHRLPAWYPVHGGWFATPVPRPALNCVIDVTFLDADNKLVSQPNHF